MSACTNVVTTPMMFDAVLARSELQRLDGVRHARHRAIKALHLRGGHVLRGPGLVDLDLHRVEAGHARLQ